MGGFGRPVAMQSVEGETDILSTGRQLLWFALINTGSNAKMKHR